ncbi:hypothetical protein BV25DRAFT_1821011 [Artomyces pyxidatus]|uniref:Uncharacterized protein n=1 Tax=Artomyces pyxidatus TaxID=48021 RepID=A0ACB8TBD3_9AGAM|nr:hypothetical protein BV25DRAFT_1821011 [Artomyces pyxidatus]
MFAVDNIWATNLPPSRPKGTSGHASIRPGLSTFTSSPRAAVHPTLCEWRQLYDPSATYLV